jgi:hypothetical protein
MCCNDAFDQRETETVAVNLTLDGVGTAVERIEDVRELRRGNPGAVIADRDAHLPSVADRRRARRECPPSDPRPPYFHGIGNQVLHHGAQRRGIAHHLWQVRSDFAMYLHAG